MTQVGLTARGRDQAAQRAGAGREVALAYFTIGVLALGGAGYHLGMIIRRAEDDRLVVLGPSRIVVEHPDRNQPLKVTFRLHNPTSRPIRVNNVSTHCRCTASALTDQIIAAGETVPLDLHVTSFDTFKRGFAESVTVETDHGRIDLWVTGTLPPTQQVLYYPQALYLESDEMGHWRKRSIRLRVPMSCARGLADLTVRHQGLGPCGVRLTERAPSTQSTQYREYVLHFFPPEPAEWPRLNGGRLLVGSGCQTVEVPVEFAGLSIDTRE